jgi:hypothetical protein
MSAARGKGERLGFALDLRLRLLPGTNGLYVETACSLLLIPELLLIDIFHWHGHCPIKGNAFSGAIPSHEPTGLVRVRSECRRRDSNPRHADYGSSEGV